jgi:hypothetical protein
LRVAIHATACISVSAGGSRPGSAGFCALVAECGGESRPSLRLTRTHVWAEPRSFVASQLIKLGGRLTYRQARNRSGATRR